MNRSMLLLSGPMPRTLELVAEAVRGAGEVREVAAGTGLFTRVVARSAARVLATDCAPAMVEQHQRRVAAERLENVACRVADVYALDLAPASVDAVVAANVLHLRPDLERALAALERAGFTVTGLEVVPGLVPIVFAVATFGVDRLPAALLVVDGRPVARFSGPRKTAGLPRG